MSIRTERVARLLQREIAGILRETGAVPLVDLTVLGSSKADAEAALGQLKDLNSRIRVALAQRIRHSLKKVPEIRFFLDETQERARRMDDLFDQIRDERDGRNA